MKLSKLIQKLNIRKICGSTDICISSVEYNSSNVKKGSLFVCIKGFNADGHSYIADVIARGAVAVIVEDMPTEALSATVICVPDTREALAYVSAAWFDHPAEKLTVIGLTGTKGKTTTAFMTKRILEEAGNKVGMIGTVGAFIGDEQLETKNTTPESFELHSFFRRMLDAGCTHVVMEVSSQGLKLKRTAGLTFDLGAFLNLSPDHISPAEHKSFEEYRDCKKKMFSQTKCVIANADSEYWQYMTEGNEVITVSTDKSASLRAHNVESVWDTAVLGSRFDVSGLYDGEILLNMPGIFNVHNALIAMAIAHGLGIGLETVKSALEKISVKGRTQLIREAADTGTFIIDYAHNALSIEALLEMLKGYSPKRLILVFGVGGDRAKQRRYDLGLAAGRSADLSILTTDNPRFDDLDTIFSQIIEGLNVYGGKYKIVLDREDAIHYAMDICQKDDIVAFVGKGHEEYQDIKGVKYYFSEEKIIKEYAASKH
ncbi:MAG: UDP-N-acetylmuramoyl-L-alanyl-D-glutamate--2,6-diaminopimelate ligase [Clostridia bacterium]|nr:UDP-N-acetylmuramoyl-L-alanyl-D-glutamate--2,6-diaminopimelate ligase [Clostridia bacterium]